MFQGFQDGFTQLAADADEPRFNRLLGRALRGGDVADRFAGEILLVD
jgi:hypothetical protein